MRSRNRAILIATSISAAVLTWPSSPAAAATAGEVSAAGTVLYSGAKTTITIDANDETGSFVVDLYRSTTRIARVATGADITAVTSVTWVIPTALSLEGTGYSFVVDTPSGAPFATTSTFDIRRSAITDVTPFAEDADPEADDPITATHAHERVLLTWDSLGATGESVAITLTPAEGKALTVAKSTDNDGAELVTVPVTGVTADAPYTFTVTPLAKTADPASSDAVAVAAANGPSVTLSTSSAALGASVDVTLGGVPSGETATLQLIGPTGKAVSTIATGQVDGTYELRLADAKVVKSGAGAYKVRATLDQAKTVVTNVDLTVTAFGTIGIGSTTTAILATGVVYGQIVPVEVTVGGSADVPVSVAITSGKKTVVLTKSMTLSDGSGTYSWLVSDKLAAGSWTLTVTNTLAKSPTSATTSSAFTIGKNPTVLDADITADPTAGGTAATSGATVSAAASTLHLGSRTVITVAPGDATGAYAIDLYKNATRIARVASGSDITAVSSAAWVIPGNASLVGTGYKFVVDTSVNAPFETSSTFAIAKPGVGNLQYGYDTPVSWVNLSHLFDIAADRESSLMKIRYDSSGTTGTLRYELVPSGATKAIVLATDMAATGVMPLMFNRTDIPAGTYTLRIVPQNTAAQPGERQIIFPGAPGAFFAVEAGDSAAPLTRDTHSHLREEGFTTQLGRTLQLVAPGSTRQTPVDMVLIDPVTNKSVAKIASSYWSAQPGFEEESWPNPASLRLTGAKLKAGTYALRTNRTGSPLTADYTVVVQDWVAPTIATETTSALAAGVTQGETVLIEWTAGTGASFPTTVTATNGSTSVVLAKKEMTTDGKGSFAWTVSEKITAGSGWKVTIANATKGVSSSVESSAFAVAADPTTLAADLAN